MSKIEIDYKYLDDAQRIYEAVCSHISDFDWRGADWDWDTNRNVFATICMELKMPFDVVSITLHNDYDETYDAIMYHQNWPVYNEVVVMTHFDWLIFDFANALDVVDLFNDVYREYYKMKDKLDLVDKLTYGKLN